MIPILAMLIFCLQKFAATQSVNDRKRTREAKLHTLAHKAFVNNCMEETPDMSARVLQGKLTDEFGIQVSINSINVYRRKLGWVQEQTRYCQLISNVNVQKRKDWCELQIRNNEQFDVSTSFYLLKPSY